MNKDKAIQLLERLQDPEPYEPMLTKDAYDAIQMAIDALSADGDTISRKAAIEVIDSFNVFESRCDQIKLEQMIGELPPANNSEIPNSSDTISRAKAIEALDTGLWGVEWDKVLATAMLEDLSPAQPEPSQVAKDIARIVENGQDMRVIAQSEIIRCKDCKHWIPYDWMFSEVWQSKNMADYSEDEIGCNYCDMTMKANDFCSRGERRTNE